MRLIFIIIISIATLMTGCGKGIMNSGAEDETTLVITDEVQASTISVSLNLEVDEQASSTQLPDSGWAIIPESPIIKESTSDYVLTELFINAEDNLGTVDLYDYQAVICEYFSLKNQLTDSSSHPNYTHTFNGCYYYHDGIREELNYLPGQEVAIDEGRYIVLAAHTSNSDQTTLLHLDIEVDWH